jgi:micrococcal nuclease
MVARMIRSVLSVFLLILLASPASADNWTGKVVHIADGDTITVLKEGHDQVKIRLYGIDCPENGQPFGSRAKQMTGYLAAGKLVTVKPRDKDRYGLIVAEIILPNWRNMNRELVGAGMAWHFAKYATSDKELARPEAEAKAAKRGLWIDRDPIAPWDWRAAHRTNPASKSSN